MIAAACGGWGTAPVSEAQAERSSLEAATETGVAGSAECIGLSADQLRRSRPSTAKQTGDVGGPQTPLGEDRAVWVESNDPELHAYASESWFTAEGARTKLRRLERAGLPNFKNWRFITLTMENHTGHPFAAYEKGKGRLRRFLACFRKAIGREFRWCWKLEFHDDGFAHWHLLVEYTKRIPSDFFPVVESWWGLGRVNVRRVEGRDIHYVFKYVAKSVEDVPEWVAYHKGRFRVFQASRGFYTKRQARKLERKDKQFSLVKVDLVTRLGWDARKARLVTVNHRGERRVRVVKLRVTFNALLVMRAHEAIRLRRQLAAPGVVNISQLQAIEIEYEHRKFAGLAGIPANAAAA